jgi:hypothetical protein
MLARYSGKRDPKEAESFVPCTPPGTKFFLRFAFDAFTFRADCRQAGSNSVTSASAATQEESRNSPELLCNLAFSHAAKHQNMAEFLARAESARKVQSL